MRFKSILLILPFILTACAGKKTPLALSIIQPTDAPAGRGVVELVEKLGDGRPAGPITLYQAVIAQGVPLKVAKKAFEKYDEHSDVVRNPTYITMVDFTQHSTHSRFYMVHRTTGRVDQWPVAHGEATDPQDDGIAKYFSNIPDSHMSSLGSYLIQEKYVSSKFGESLRLDGLESSNSNVRDRAIVLHPSHYVVDGRTKQGRSWGCPAIPYANIQTVIARAQDGSFMYVYGVNQRSTAMDAQILARWNLIPKALWTDESEY
ncbi:MAG: murein L,D-transpeptidase catalytic domain-containing protein [Bdellovibrionales bacterium]